VYVTLKSPKGGTKRDFAVIARKIQLLSKDVFCKVSLRENLQAKGKVAATSFLYLISIYRRIAGDVSIYLKLALKVTHPFRKCQF